MIFAIRNADDFMASLFVGVGKYEKVIGGTVKAAVIAGCEMAARRSSARRPLLYAIGPDGNATMLSNELVDRLLKAVKR
jgi:hypothetical protein